MAKLLLLLLLIVLLRITNCAPYYTSSVCTQTPYPELCNSLILTTNTLHQNLNDLSLKASLDEAQIAHNLISNMDTSSLNELAKIARVDCLDLYDDTIHQLNRSLASKSAIDAQTWLSAAIANEQTCQNGFLDFNFSSFPFMLTTDFPKLLSNSLAINKAALNYNTTPNKNRRLLMLGPHDFPEWVSATSRKLLQSSSSPKADIVVARDGSGDYRTISEALAAAAKSRSGSKRFVIYVKKGIYKENVEVKRSMKNIMLIGDGIDATLVTGSKNVQDGSTTFRSATFAATGDGFIARGITFENTAGAAKHQAVALRCGSDFSVFYECSFKGYQDTLYVYSQRQFYRDCDIYGTVDFIFGDAVSVIQNCNIYIRPAPNQRTTTITAQGKKDPNENTGIIIHNSHVSGSTPAAASSRNYLGRPWHKYSTTVFIKCTIDGLIDPAGWLPWNGDFAFTTLYYGEYMNTGSGAATGRRVTWPGFHVITSASVAGKFSVRNFLAGESWIPSTGQTDFDGMLFCPRNNLYQFPLGGWLLHHYFNAGNMNESSFWIEKVGEKGVEKSSSRALRRSSGFPGFGSCYGSGFGGDGIPKLNEFTLTNRSREHSRFAAYSLKIWRKILISAVKLMTKENRLDIVPLKEFPLKENCDWTHHLIS
ncbi:hypothetical protein ACS0TY_032883 [Phlomoides rotata]